MDTLFNLFNLVVSDGAFGTDKVVSLAVLAARQLCLGDFVLSLVTAVTAKKA